MNRSRFRGVYKCGKRWKSQIQVQGVQFYLGIFDNEVEAARAYDVKAFEEKGDKGLMNFNRDGTEVINYSKIVSNFDKDDQDCKRRRLESASFNDGNKNMQLNLQSAWEKLCQLSSRLEAAYENERTLLNLTTSSDDIQHAYLKSTLREEICLLNATKQSIEDHIVHIVEEGIQESTKSIKPTSPSLPLLLRNFTSAEKLPFFDSFPETLISTEQCVYPIDSYDDPLHTPLTQMECYNTIEENDDDLFWNDLAAALA